MGHNEHWCEWHGDSDGLWGTSCGKAFEFTEDGPEANGFKFCPYCGNPLVEVAYADEDVDEELDQAFDDATEKD